MEKEMATTPVFLPGKSHGQRSLVGYSPWGHKESDTTQWLNNNNKHTSYEKRYFISFYFIYYIYYINNIFLLKFFFFKYKKVKITHSGFALFYSPPPKKIHSAGEESLAIIGRIKLSWPLNKKKRTNDLDISLTPL